MSLRRLALAAVAAGTLYPAVALAQAAGGVPAYDPPPPAAPPERDGPVMTKAKKEGGTAAGSFAEQGTTVANFSNAYTRNGRPRLALYWNKQLSEALSDWYSDVRVVNSSQNNSSMSGDFNLNQSGNSQNTLEVQRRAQDSRRGAVTESFEWEFQEAFLAPFLEAGATIVDRGAMMRFAAADQPSSGEKTIEVPISAGEAPRREAGAGEAAPAPAGGGEGHH